ncbi:MAG TPA: proton-conducting transporter membrane subunit [Bryobacteraceae bacterium]|nr:proton-conducting transporter membrane subunit [Bryobacteraceae bacterium]
MHHFLTPRLLLTCTVLTPGLLFLTLGLGWLLGWTPREATIVRSAKLAYGFASVTALGLIASMWFAGLNSVSAGKGAWYAIHRFEIPLVLFVDWLSLPLIALTVVLVGLVTVFSKRYMHRDPGFHRFFVLVHLFAFGALLVFAAGSFDLLVGGWELICVSSALLVAYFQKRPEPARSAIRVFITYRICDIGLMIGAFYLHHLAGSTLYTSVFTGSWPSQASVMQGGSATLIGLLLLFAAMGKSAQVPVSGWMPRAMEGPTPSSAIFYGAISVHVGAYLLLRAQPLLTASSIASAAVIVVGALSAIHGTMVARACTDAKTSLAYSSISQLGLIFVEIGFGLSWLALLHIAGHAIVRTLQFLKAPSALHEFHEIHAAAGGHLVKTGAHFDTLLPARLQLWLYRLALDRGHHDAILDRFVAGPARRFAIGMASLEERLTVTRAPRPERALDV